MYILVYKYMYSVYICMFYVYSDDIQNVFKYLNCSIAVTVEDITYIIWLF